MNKKIIYAAPLKALSTERFEDWKKRYKDKKIVMLTGDTLYSAKEREKQMPKAAKADIIIMTSELLDSITRHYKTQKYYFLKDVALLIVDEAHLLTSENRGHTIESAIMRFTSINSEARICFLSATMSNLDELANWLTNLNGKKTNVIKSSWRPVPLEANYIEYEPVVGRNGYVNYAATQNVKEQMTVDLILSKPDEKWLCFVHAKNTGRNLVKKLREMGIDTYFHNADLDKIERAEIEEKFKDRENGIKVLVSTSTTAIGVNMPARNVVVVGVHRGLNEVDELDIIQEFGRAGRPQYDDKGFAYLLVPFGSIQTWKHKIENPRPVISVLNNHNILAFHVLAEIQNKKIRSVDELMQWYSRSLACRQGVYPFSTKDAEALMKDLEAMEMIGYSGITPFVTGLGKASSWLYFSPYDIFAWYKNFKLLIEGKQSSKNYGDTFLDIEETSPIGITDETLAWALGDIPSNNLGYIPKDIANEAKEWKWRLRNRKIQASDAIVTVIGFYNNITGVDIKEEKGLLKAVRRSVIFDIDRVSSALSLIDGMYAKWNKDSIWETLPIRIKYGIPEEMIGLVKLKGIGGVRAKKMWNKGIKSIDDVANNKNKKALASIFKIPFVLKIQKEAREMITT